MEVEEMTATAEPIETSEYNDWRDAISEEDLEYLKGPPRVDFSGETALSHPGFDDREKCVTWTIARGKWVDWLAKRHPGRCVFCGGRTVHSPGCFMFDSARGVRMRWGKHRGKRLGDVPRSYLHWLAYKAEAVDDTLREAVERVLEGTG
jgi:hypothetical protein